MTFIEKVKLNANLAGHKVKKHSPAIWMGVGLVAFGGTVVAAYKARPKFEAIIEDVEARRCDGQEINKMQVIKDIGRVIALPVALGTLATSSVVISYRIQHNRIMTLAGVLATTQAAQKAFEDRFKEKFGEVVYNEFLTTEDSEYQEVTEDGTEVETVKTIKKDIDSFIGEWYDKSSEYARDDYSYNMMYIAEMSSQLDTKLFSKGHLLMNEVRDKLGFERTRSGALLGWSSADYFNIEAIPHITKDPITGEMTKQIFVKWTAPKYIYMDADFGSN